MDSMDIINNSMINNTNPNKKKSEHMTKSKKSRKENIKEQKLIKTEITCEKEPKKKYNITSEEFAIHIIDCDECLKKLFLSQAKRKEKEAELLLEKSHKRNKKKKKNINDNDNINNSMARKYQEDTADNSDESSENNDSSSNDENGDNIDINDTMINNTNLKQNSKKKNNKRKSSYSS